jgi:hypothetical protein
VPHPMADWSPDLEGWVVSVLAEQTEEAHGYERFRITVTSPDGASASSGLWERSNVRWQTGALLIQLGFDGEKASRFARGLPAR